MMDAAKIVQERLKLPEKYLKNVSRSDRVEGIVHKSWIRELVEKRRVPDQFVLHDQLSSTEVEAWLKQNENFGPLWQNLLFRVVKKRDCAVIPLPRARPRNKPDAPLSYCQALRYVYHTNHKNLWKEAFKKYSNGAVGGRPPDCGTVQLTDSASVLREVIQRVYGCPVVPLDVPEPPPRAPLSDPDPISHLNLLPCVVALEANSYFILIHDCLPGHTLLDCVTFSPAALSSHGRALFVIYQLLCLLRHVHDRGLVLGDVSLSDIHVDKHLWIQVLPRLEANLYEFPRQVPTREAPVVPERSAQNLNNLTLAWVRGALSNLDYLTALNKLAGRRYGDPRCHHVLPWVTDFTSPTGANWRDLTKSKFRLNKGDRQLDLTYDLPPTSNLAQVPHHVSDVLSEITYYVYLARVTPRSVLCQYVRPQWVPAEYPSSIQRLQQWTPDECIPEFFTDPGVFKSVHSDLPDLEVPVWASSAEQLVSQHRAALESPYVSERLHHWIDLTFGYKLSGQAAVKSKNVCLQLVDGHTSLTDCGVVQLFSNPHPQRAPASPYWGITPPRIHHRQRTKGGSDEEEGGPSSGGEDSVSVATPTPLALTRLLSKSRSSLQTSGSTTSPASILLPHDYSPAGALLAVESLHTFTGQSEGGAAGAGSQAGHCKQVVAACRHQEMQVLGCVIVEMFLSHRLQLFDQPKPFPQRLSVCRTALAGHRDSVPRCVRSLVSLLLDERGGEVPVTSGGTPPPSAHQLLQPALSAGLLPLPPTTPTVYAMVTALREHSAALTALHAVRDARPDTDQLLTTICDKLCEWKVQTAAGHVQQLVEAPQPRASLDLVLGHVLELLADPDTAVSAAWYIFDPVAKALGPVDCARLLLEPMVRLYDCDPAVGSPHHLKKRIKLYHRSFLLRLIVRFRLRVFLEHFVTPLVEAVGGYHDVDLFLPVETRQQFESEVEEATECASVLSPLDEDSSADSEKTPLADNTLEPDSVETDPEMEPEVFVLETEGEDSAEQVASLLLDLQSDDGDEPDIPDETRSEHWADNETETTAPTDQIRSPAAQYNKVSEVGEASMQWLTHRLGPVLTATHLSRNLLRMLSLCYAARGVTPAVLPVLQGDESAAAVLRCLTAIVGLYGEQFVVVQYVPATADVIALARKKLTASLEAGVVAHLTLLTHCLPYLTDDTLHHLFQDVVLGRVCGPALRLVSSLRQLFPGAVAGRRAVAVRLVQCLHSLMLRATTEQKIALVHIINKLFLVFGKARGLPDDTGRSEGPVDRVREGDAASSFSPPGQTLEGDGDTLKSKALEELSAVMSAELAHWAYGPFASYYGETLMEQSLKNHSLVRQLCEEHRQLSDCASTGDSLGPADSLSDKDVEDSVGSFGTNVVIIGNRIDLQEPVSKSASPGTVGAVVATEDESDTSSRRTDSTTRHLRGNWLSYWQQEVSHTSPQLDVKQIRLMGFSGHSHSVRALATLDNENSFISASRDKTVKLWSLRSMGDGSAVCPAQWTYTGHRKSVLAVGFCETARLVASCDSAVHLWDPYVGRMVAQTDPARGAPVNTLRPLPAPSYQVLAATTEPTLRTLDTRVGAYVNELKVACSGGGVVRCIATAPGASWVALGQASGQLTVLDRRTGTVMASWRGHDGEVLQLVAANDSTIVSSSLDQAVSVWSPHDGKLKFNVKGLTEPVHCLDMCGGELVSGTTANRIGVHSAVDPAATFSSTRLRSDGFKGVLTCLQVLPLNRLLLLGADTGAIYLIC